MLGADGFLHSTEFQLAWISRLQAEHASRLRELELRAELAEALGARREAEVQAANEQLKAQAGQLAVSGQAVGLWWCLIWPIALVVGCVGGVGIGRGAGGQGLAGRRGGLRR